ncbi:hypothetical protein PHYC_00893 [Phycisphaerales bacterium]|nr:hypothetical protein PHYC_00893 [Phycisphaerales bacterium]
MRTREKKIALRAPLAAAAGAVFFLLAACSTPRDQGAPAADSRERATNRSSEARAVFEAPTAPSGDSAPTDAAWTIILATVPGDGGDMSAMRALDTVRAYEGLAEARVEKRSKGMVIALGRYESPTDPRAREDLERVQSIESGGARPFEGAMLVPPPFDPRTGSIPELDLSTVKARFGRSALYSLQVAVYERSDGKPASESEMGEFRRAAEQAAKQFRADGEEAYYYHGPRRSMVTIGVFGPRDYEDQPSSDGRLRHIESPGLRMLREKHPYNLVNGQAIIVRSSAHPQGRMQPSFVVAIPD